MAKIKVDLVEATSSKSGIEKALKNFSTNVNYSNSTAGVYAQDDMVSLSEEFKSTRESIKTSLKRDTEKIEKLTINFIDIDKEATNKSINSMGNHSKK